MEEYSPGNPDEEARHLRKIAALTRESTRLRNTASFRLGLHLTNAGRQPWKLPLLPITFPLLCLKIGFERLGRKPSPKPQNNLSQGVVPRENSIILFPTNGVGFGHFTRMYAIARELRKNDPSMEIIFFTTMPTLHIPYSENFATYHLAGRHKQADMDSATWNIILEEMLTLILEIHNPRYFMFDGSFPYRGMLNAIYGRDEITKLWMRRGMFKRGSKIPVDSIERFDHIVHPGDAISNSSSDLVYDVNTIHIPPITLLNQEDMYSREMARKRLGIPINVRVVYIQLGAGQINDIESEIRMTIDSLLFYKDVHIVLGESMLGERIEIVQDCVHLLRDYPNSLYCNTFDYSVQAGGYNSFHEMRFSGMPTLFYPNLSTGMDDQLARCQVSVKEGWGIVLRKRTRASIKSAIEKLLKMSHVDNGQRGSGAAILAQKLGQEGLQ